MKIYLLTTKNPKGEECVMYATASEEMAHIAKNDWNDKNKGYKTTIYSFNIKTQGKQFMTLSKQCLEL